MTWWISSPRRFAKERDELAKLAENSATLRVLRSHLRDNLALAIEVEVSVADAWQPLTFQRPARSPPSHELAADAC